MGSLANGGTPDVKGLHRAEEVEDASELSTVSYLLQGFN